MTDYYDSIKETAQEILIDHEVKTIQDYNSKPEIFDRVSEEADSACIYDSDCDDIIAATENEEAYKHSTDLTGNFQEIKLTVAYFAYYQDLVEALQELVSDLPEDWELEEEEEAA